jgi:plasmid stabilization system protein ParE
VSRTVVVDEDAALEAEAQARYYEERAGEVVSMRFVAEVAAIFRGLADNRFVGVTHPRVRFRLPVKRVFLDRFPFAVVFFVDNDVVTVVAVEALKKRPGYWAARLRSR